MTNEEEMTNDFAKIVLLQLNTDKQLNVREHEAIRVAIKALEQQTCEDAISREDALMALTGEWTELTDELIHRFIRRIKKLPSVNPQQKWIPVNQGMPEENKTVIASTKFGVYPEARYSKEDGWEWAYESGADYWEELEYVTAWMPLPKNYEPQESEVSE